jgi:FixJ family two-component response regulator
LGAVEYAQSLHTAGTAIWRRLVSGEIGGKDGGLSKEPLIAVVDDDASFRMALAESLRSLGYDAREFASAEEFISGGVEGPCDCVITDIRMPGMSGFELSRLLASRHPWVPVIMITAVAEPGLEGDAKISGSVCLLKKPFQSDALIDCLQRALRR